MPNHENLRVWNEARTLGSFVYAISGEWPASEKYGMTSQIRRAATSIGANIAEGAGRGSDADFRRFIRMAIGSTNEVDHFLVLAGDLDWISSDTLARGRQLISSLRMQLSSLNRTLTPK
jgi:four helix bundle protein